MNAKSHNALYPHRIGNDKSPSRHQSSLTRSVVLDTNPQGMAQAVWMSELPCCRELRNASGSAALLPQPKDRLSLSIECGFFSCVLWTSVHILISRKW